MDTETRRFIAKASLGLLSLAAGMLGVVGLVWLLNAKFGFSIPSVFRNIAAVTFGVFLLNKVAGQEFARQYEIEQKKRPGGS